jgi:hypothetical protein
MNCDRCGQPVELPCEPSSLMVYVCPKCGHSVRGVFDAAPEHPPARMTRVCVVWRGGKADPVQVAKLRTLFPGLAGRSISDLVSASGEEPTMPIGVFPDWEAREIRQKCVDAGIDLRLVDE